MSRETVNDGVTLFVENRVAREEDYYLYIVSLMRLLDYARLRDAPLCIDLDTSAAPSSSQQDVTGAGRFVIVRINTEHTLVKPGGRDTEGAMRGHVPIRDSTMTGETYLVRLHRRAEFESCHLLLDYSVPNVVNTAMSAFPSHIPHVYVAPLLYYPPPPPVPVEHRNIPCLTTFVRTCEPRRARFLEQLRRRCPAAENRNDVFGHHALLQVYRRTRVLMNIRQTDHHDTLEELRVLPALLCGVLVISEDVPLRTCVPYHAHVLWCSSFDEMMDTLDDVSRHYDQYVSRIFDQTFYDLMDTLHAQNQERLQNAMARILS
ncbi:hypothetical protein EBZ80_16025 [bacterium]|nr:hypothetical protein [bacterium]